MAENITLSEAYHVIGQQTLYIGRLEKQNEKLRAQLKVVNNGLSDDVAIPAPLDRPDERHLDLSRDDARELASTHARTLLKYRQLRIHHSRCERTVRQALEKARRYKDWARQWESYLKDLYPQLWAPVVLPSLEKVSSVDCRKVRQESTVTDQTSLKSAATPESHGSSAQDEPVGTYTDILSSPAGGVDFLASSTATRVQLETGLPRVTSSQTTVTEDLNGDTESTVQVKAEPDTSDGDPVLISARCLKRKRSKIESERPTFVPIKQEPTTPEHPIVLKSDEYISPITPPGVLFRTETSDLDQIGVATITPRRPKRSTASHGQETASKDSNKLVPPPLPRLKPLESIRSHLEQHRAFQNSHNRERDHVSFGAQHHDSSTSDFTRRSALDKKDSPVAALRSISNNVPRTSPVKSGRKARQLGIAAKVRIISEDGEDVNSQTAPVIHSVPDKEPPPAPTTDRLEAILLEPWAGRPSLVTGRSGGAVIPDSNTTSASAKNCRKHAMKQYPPAESSTAAASRGAEPAPPQPRPEDEPLRLRPMRSLRLEDFRVNPEYLGTEFAFADTLRGRDQRRGLHTCTRLECCGGALAKVIELGGTSMSGRTDAQVLEAYLGPDWAVIVGGYGPPKRKEIVMQAHAFSFANQHGKHKQAFERPRSPPGFWRMDMATTQEAEEDRKQAQEMEGARVEERWREAMREGGRWKFRDE